MSVSSFTSVSALFPAFSDSISISTSFLASARMSIDCTSFTAFSAVFLVSPYVILPTITMVLPAKWPTIPRTKSTVGFSTHHCESKHLQSSCVAASPVEPAHPAHLINCLKMLGALRQCTYISIASKKHKDKIRTLDQVTDGAGTRGDPEYLTKCEAKEV